MTPKLIGKDPAIRSIRHALVTLANCNAHILIFGEPGVGRALVARMIHSAGPERCEQLRSLNFALLAEREQRFVLFGSEPPDATNELQGVLEFKTTCLLRNIENAIPLIQHRLVDALVSKEYRRAPGGPLRSVQSRIIFTTSETDFLDFRKSRLTQEFRNYLRRLPKFVIPPLRERVQDIPLIAAHYRKHALRLPNPALPPDDTLLASDFARKHPWHENVTELKACLRAALTHSHTDLLRQRDRLEIEKMIMLIEEGSEFSLRESTGSIETHILQRVLASCGNHRTQAAHALGLTRGTLLSRERRSNP